MKNSTIIALFNIMRHGSLTADQVSTLFDIYANQEIMSMDDLENKDHYEFLSFICDNISYFSVEDRKEARANASYRVNALRQITNKNFYSYKKNQVNFATEVGLLLNFDKDKKILEVGSGFVPYSSMLLGDAGYDISSMDEFYLPEECLSRFNVKSFRSLFNQKTKVKDYDIVVGRKPCTAILPLVEKCSSEGVPYFIRLCGCELPAKSVYGWRHILNKVDSNIQYSGAYAYNLQGDNNTYYPSINSVIEIDNDRIMI